MRTSYSDCHGDPRHDTGCNCAAYERYQESDQYEIDLWLDAVMADEPPAELPEGPPVTAWECNGLSSCRALVDRKGDYCLSCEQIATDAMLDARMEAAL